MKAICPNNPKHDRFVTVAHVTEDWIVDSEGNLVEVSDTGGEVVAPPDPDNTWTCCGCGAEAIVTRSCVAATQSPL